MAELFAGKPEGGGFVIRRLDMRGRKVDMPSMPAKPVLHCFFFITGGEALIEIGDESYCFKANECAVVPAGHAFSVRWFDNCSGYMGGFGEDFLDSGSDGRNIMQTFSVLRKWGTHKVLFDAEHGGYVESVFERLRTEHEKQGNRNIIRSYLIAMLTEIEEMSLLQRGTADPAQTENELCNRFVEMVFECSDHSLPLSDYAARLNTTRDNLHRIMKQFTDKTPLDWINEAVILEAKVLLGRTAKPVGEIAAEAGFSDPSYFSRLFRKKTGTTPLEYRKSRKSQNMQE